MIDACKTPSQALEGYIEEMSKWVDLAKQGQSSKEVIPVYVPPTTGNALAVEKRLKVLQEIIAPAFRVPEAERGLESR